MGELKKTQVRELAAEIRLPNAKKKDSTGICFIGERPFREFLNRYLSHEPGAIEDDRGRTIGRHVGLSFYTLGQRQGLGIGGLKPKGGRGGAEHAPWYVARKDLSRNVLRVVQGHDHPWLQSSALQRGRRQLGRGPRAARRALRRQDALSPGRRRLRAVDARGERLRAGVRRAAMGGDAGPVGRAVRRRGVPRRRRDRRAER